MNRDNQNSKIEPIDRRLLIEQRRLIQEEGRKTRSTIWLAALLLLACVLFAPFLLDAAPFLIAGALVIMVGKLTWNYFSRRRERVIMKELQARTSSVNEGKLAKTKDTEQNARDRRSSL